MNQETDNEGWSLSLARAIGYSLLILALFDVIDRLVPPQLMNPVWEFQTIGALVEGVPVPLLGLLLIFYGETEDRRKWEKLLLKFLSWGCLMVGLLFLLLIPLGVNNVIRIHYQNQNQINAQFSQQNYRLQQMKSQVKNATAEDMNGMITALRAQGRSPEIEDPQELKLQMSEQIATAESRLSAQYATAHSNQRLGLIKRATKWLLGASIAGVLYIRIWHETRWARQSYKRGNKW